MRKEQGLKLKKEVAELKTQIDCYKSLESHYEEIEEDAKAIAKENEELKAKLKGFENGDVAWQGDMDRTIEQNLELKKEVAELKKDKEWLDNTNNEQTKVILELQEHIREVENDSNNCEHWSYTRIKQLEAQIERMKCCGNCKHREDCVYEHAWNLCDKWEMIE